MMLWYSCELKLNYTSSKKQKMSYKRKAMLKTAVSMLTHKYFVSSRMLLSLWLILYDLVTSHKSLDFVTSLK